SVAWIRFRRYDYFYCWYGDHRVLHSFPTRRSSDLAAGAAAAWTALQPDQSALALLLLAGGLVAAGAAWLESGPGSSKELAGDERSEEHTSELQSRGHLVCRLLLEKKK